MTPSTSSTPISRTTPAKRGPPRGFLAKALVVVAAGGLLASWPAWAAAGVAGIVAVQLAAAVAWLGAAAGRGAGALVPRSAPDRPVHASLAALGGRLLGTAVLALVVVVSEAVPAWPFALALVPLYLALLAFEVHEAVVALRVPAARSEVVAR